MTFTSSHTSHYLEALYSFFSRMSVLIFQVPLRMSVDAISFSAHADFPQTNDFIDKLQPKHVILVHGEATEMIRLKRALEQRASAMGQQRYLYTPKVTQPVHITHKITHTAKVIMDQLWRMTRLISSWKQLVSWQRLVIHWQIMQCLHMQLSTELDHARVCLWKRIRKRERNWTWTDAVCQRSHL